MRMGPAKVQAVLPSQPWFTTVSPEPIVLSSCVVTALTLSTEEEVQLPSVLNPGNDQLGRLLVPDSASEEVFPKN